MTDNCKYKKYKEMVRKVILKPDGGEIFYGPSVISYMAGEKQPYDSPGSIVCDLVVDPFEKELPGVFYNRGEAMFEKMEGNCWRRL